MAVKTVRLAGPMQMNTSTLTAIYTVPTDGSVTAAVITSINVVNVRTDSTIATYGIAVKPNGVTLDSNSHSIIGGRLVSPGDMPDVLEMKVMLAPGDAICATASHGAVTITVNGATFS